MLPLRLHRARRKLVFSRSQRSYSSLNEGRQVQVRTGSNGHITLNIRPPLEPGAPRSIVLHLPSGPFAPSRVTGILQSALDSANLKSTVVGIAYRFSPEHRYPTPMHDVLAGYDWVVQHLAKGVESGKPPRISVCGELMGGGLAAMLALTESHRYGSKVSSVCMLNPILDWTFPDAGDVLKDETIIKARSAAPKPKSWEVEDSPFDPSTTQLLNARKLLFRTRETYFDQLASPLLLFRTPSVEFYSQQELERREEYNLAPDVVSSAPDPVSLPGSASDNRAFPASEGHDNTAISLGAFNLEERAPEYESKRSYNLLFPPYNSSLRLPPSLIVQSPLGPLRDQSEEFARLMRRSIVTNEFGIRRSQRTSQSDTAEKYKDNTIHDELQTKPQNQRERNAVLKAESRVKLVFIDDEDEHDISQQLIRNILVDGST